MMETMVLSVCLILCCISLPVRLVRSSVKEKVESFYTTSPLKVGVEVHGIDLKGDIAPDVIQQIKDDVTRYNLVVFRDQGLVNASRHVEITQWFGGITSSFQPHKKTPHPHIFRVSNDGKEGMINAGTFGWHIDGSFELIPHMYSIFHMVEFPKKGNTVFVSLNKLVTELSEEQKTKWDRLYWNNVRVDVIHPLIYLHPVTGLETMNVHMALINRIIWDDESSARRVSSKQETNEIMKEILEQFQKDDNILQYSHKWQPGDFIIMDNRAVAHEATKETKMKRDLVGLRVLHRTTVEGTVGPSKHWTDTRDEL